MKKVLYLLTGSDVGGAQRYVFDLVKHLPREEFTSKILFGGSDARWLSNRVSPLFLYNDWFAVFELIGIFRRERPDIIHLNSSKAGVVGTLAAGVYKFLLTLNPKPYTLYPRIVFTAHGWVFNPTNYLSFPVRGLYILLHKIAARMQDAIICVSEYDRQLALRCHIAPEAKLHAIRNGIDYTNLHFLDKVSARTEILKRFPLPVANYQLPVTGVWIGSIGRLVKEKDYGTFIRAATQIPNAYFFIIGAGTEQKKLQVLCSTFPVSDRMFFVPPTGTDARILKAFDLFVLSSIKEGLPYTLLEAMAAQVPVVTTRIGGMTEVVGDGEAACGAMVPAADPHALAAAITAALAHPDQTRQKAARAKHKIIAELNVETMTAHTARLYARL